jgi:hypothetical protein
MGKDEGMPPSRLLIVLTILAIIALPAFLAFAALILGFITPEQFMELFR